MRRAIDCRWKAGDARYEEFMGHAAAIEREVSERYQELAADIDGVPIRERDSVDVRGHDGTWGEGHSVVAVCDGGCYVSGSCGPFHANATDVRHHKERTLRDVLHDLVLNCVTVDGFRLCDGVSVPVLGCDDTFLDDWMSEHEGEVVLGDQGAMT